MTADSCQKLTITWRKGLTLVDARHARVPLCDVVLGYVCSSRPKIARHLSAPDLFRSSSFYMPFSIGLRFVTTRRHLIMSPSCQALARLNELHSKHDACVTKIAAHKTARKRAKADVRQVRAAKDGLVTKVHALRTTFFQGVQRDAAKLLDSKSGGSDDCGS